MLSQAMGWPLLMNPFPALLSEGFTSEANQSYSEASSIACGAMAKDTMVKRVSWWQPVTQSTQAPHAEQPTPSMAFALEKFLKDSGGSVKIGHAAWEFFSRYPEYKAALGNLSFIAFCEKYPQLFCIQHKEERLALVQRTTSAADVATALASFVKDMGGSINNSGIGEFYRRYPAHGSSRLGLHDLAELCKRNSHLLCFQSSEHAGQFQISLAPAKAVTEAQVTEALADFIRSSGGSVGSAGLGEFMQNEAYKAVVYGRTVSEFCQQHRELFNFEKSSTSPGFRITLRNPSTRPVSQSNAQTGLDDEGNLE